MNVIATTQASPPRRRSVLIAVLLAGILLVFAFRGVDWESVFSTLRHGILWRLLGASCILSLSYAMRAMRWRVLLSARRRVQPLVVFWATALGYLGNCYLPARAGEVIRSTMLGRTTAMGTSYVLATALVERIIDAVVLVCITLTAVTTLMNLPAWMLAAEKFMVAIAACGLFAILLAPHFAPALRRALPKVLLSAAIRGTVDRVLDDLLLGMRSLQHPGRALLFIELTALIWLLDAVVIQVTASAFSLSLSLTQALLLLAALGLSSAAPSTPGYIGIYQFVAVTVLVPLGYSKDAALALILGFQGVCYAVVTLWGTLGLWQLSRKEQRPEQPGLDADLPAQRQEAAAPFAATDAATVSVH